MHREGRREGGLVRGGFLGGGSPLVFDKERVFSKPWWSSKSLVSTTDDGMGETILNYTRF